MSPVNYFHAEVLARLHAASFDHPWNKRAFEALLRLPTTQGLVDEAGFILCSVVCDEAEILTLCTLPNFRRQGVASRLLNEMEKGLKEKGIHSFFLDVRSDNVAALALYQKHGFQPVSKRADYYETADGKKDALLLKKMLK